jgi:hypothetical protein
MNKDTKQAIGYILAMAFGCFLFTACLWITVIAVAWH